MSDVCAFIVIYQLGLYSQLKFCDGLTVSFNSFCKEYHVLHMQCRLTNRSLLFVGALDRSPPAAPSATNQLGSDATRKCVKSCRENDHDSVLSSTNASSPEKQISSSLVLVAAPPPPVNAEALAMVPFRSKPKSKSCQVAQRRVRRPFSVAEVEALVQAVEKLGTGRFVLLAIPMLFCQLPHSGFLVAIQCLFIQVERCQTLCLRE